MRNVELSIYSYSEVFDGGVCDENTKYFLVKKKNKKKKKKVSFSEKNSVKEFEGE